MSFLKKPIACKRCGAVVIPKRDNRREYCSDHCRKMKWQEKYRASVKAQSPQ